MGAHLKFQLILTGLPFLTWELTQVLANFGPKNKILFEHHSGTHSESPTEISADSTSISISGLLLSPGLPGSYSGFWPGFPAVT